MSRCAALLAVGIFVVLLSIGGAASAHWESRFGLAAVRPAPGAGRWARASLMR